MNRITPSLRLSVLKKRNQKEDEYGQAVLLIGLMQIFVVVVVFSVAFMYFEPYTPLDAITAFLWITIALVSDALITARFFGFLRRRRRR